MRNMQSLQLVKEQLKIKSVELRKIAEEKNFVSQKLKDVMTFNQEEVKKLKNTIKEKEAEVQEQKEIANAARLSKHVGKDSKSEDEGEAKTEQELDEATRQKIENLQKSRELLKDKIKEGESKHGKLNREKEVLLKELKRLRQDTNTVDNLKERIQTLKDELVKAKKMPTGAAAAAVAPEILKEKDSLIEKYEKMLYGNVDPGEEGMLPSEIIQELKDEVEELEKERRKMLVELEMLREDNAEIEMKLTLLEEKKGGGGGEEKGTFGEFSDSRAATQAEFGGGLENFLVTYSDMMTLLLVIFVLMFTVSKMDEERFAEALSSFQEQKMKIESVNVRLTKDEMKMLERIKELVKDNVDPESLVRSDTRTILKRLPTADLFPPGEATLIEGAKNLIINTMQEDVKEGVKQILVDGHTDNVPIHSDKYPSNWELSAARASTVARFIIDEMRFPPDRMVVTGYGEFRPLKANTSDEHRAMNRRIEIKILKDIKVAEAEAKQHEQQQGGKAGPGAGGQAKKTKTAAAGTATPTPATPGQASQVPSGTP
ncbi:MAG: hypothetical protein COV67_01210 [Nitrospinae bacterium CG11_big_fil_rev_8_21_14_0_20_56_8]|nr:MAG: hypothetical protein COV67_01210 [Nitrospinae bacterium CG11_big_fil_rev_8_21_14_0_20_56_8]